MRDNMNKNELYNSNIRGYGELDIFESIKLEVVRGKVLPSLHDLIRGCPFMGDDIHLDAITFSNQIFDKWFPTMPSDIGWRLAFASLSASSDSGSFLTAANAMESALGKTGEMAAFSKSISRCYLYAAITGDRNARCKVAAAATEMLYSDDLAESAVPSYCRAATAWLMAATDRLDVPSHWNIRTAHEFIDLIDVKPGIGQRLFERMLETRSRLKSRKCGYLNQNIRGLNHYKMSTKSIN
jgi:hypothetical protein